MMLLIAGVGLGIPAFRLFFPESTSLNNTKKKEKIVTILVADFDGPKSENYRVTENILQGIRSKLEGYEDVKVVSMGKAITERDGKKVARQMAQQQNADILVWGWYAATDKNAQVSVNFEVLDDLNYEQNLGVMTSYGQIKIEPIAKLDSFTLQLNLAKEMTYLSLLTIGLSQYSRGDWDGAIRRMTAALESTDKMSDRGTVHFYRAIAYYNIKKFDQAVMDYGQAITYNPLNSSSYYNRSILYQQLADYNNAIKDCNIAINLSPNSSKYYSLRGDSYSQIGKYKEALEDFNKSISLDPDSTYTYVSRGYQYRLKGENDRAIEDYSRAIKISSNNSIAYSMRGFAYISKGENDRAIEDSKQALKIDSNSLNAHHLQGLYYIKKGERLPAFEAFNRSIKINSDNSSYSHINRGVSYFYMDEYDRTIIEIKKAINLNSNHFAGYNNLCEVYVKKGDYNKGIEDCNRGLKLNSNYYDTYRNLGDAYRGKGDNDRAIDYYNQSLQLNSNIVESYYGRGLSHSNKGNKDQMIQDFKRVLELNPDPDVRANVKKKLFELGMQ